MSRKLISSPTRTALVALLATATLSGCAQYGKVPLARSLSGECGNLARPVPLPPIARKDLGVLAAENRAGLVQANGRLNGTRACIDEERRAYQEAK